jgi:aryl-alcohol dehydrogenase-like predicted oxidoreductase
LKLAIGTAQFGSSYGIKQDGQPTPDEINKILNLARQAGIDTIDTAPAYNCDCDFTCFKVVQKTPYRGECYALLAHDPEAGLPKHKTAKIGVSVYTPEELERYIDDIDIIQLPLNIADNRFLPFLPKLRERGVEIHARSVFLQGALLIGYGVPKLGVKVCLGYALAQDVDRVVVGVNSVQQLEELLQVKPVNYRGLNITDGRVIDPREWRD